MSDYFGAFLHGALFTILAACVLWCVVMAFMAGRR